MKFSKIVGKMLVSKGVIGAPQAIFHITKHGINPAKYRMLCALGTAANNMHFVLTTDIGNGGKACKPAANYRAAWQEMALTSVAGIFALKPDDTTELHLYWLSFFSGVIWFQIVTNPISCGYLYNY